MSRKERLYNERFGVMENYIHGVYLEHLHVSWALLPDFMEGHHRFTQEQNTRPVGLLREHQ